MGFSRLRFRFTANGFGSTAPWDFGSVCDTGLGVGVSALEVLEELHCFWKTTLQQLPAKLKKGPGVNWNAPEPPLDAARRDAAALEREHVRAHLRARRKLLEIESLLDALKSEVEASQESAVGAGAEERVMRLCEKVERKAAEAALMGQRLVELHRQIDGCGLPTDGLHSAGKED
nr:PREDICTED: MORF4 family-associated protein 1-like [Equus przewalskii]